MKNRKNNKGFSLVELIVVVAIMAVLVGVLAPAYLKYVEQSREKKDLNNLEEVRHAVEVVLADEEAFAMVVDGSQITIAATANGTAGAIADASLAAGVTAGDFAAKVEAIAGTDVELVSKKYNKAQTIEIDITDGVITVAPAGGDWAFNS